MTDYSNCPGCRILRHEADELREHNRQLSDLIFGIEDTWPLFPGVTPFGEKLLRVLYRRKEVITKQAIYEVACLDKLNPPGEKVIDVQICKLRKCLPPESIETFWGRGIQLTAVGRLFVKELLDAHREKLTHAFEKENANDPDKDRSNSNSEERGPDDAFRAQEHRRVASNARRDVGESRG